MSLIRRRAIAVLAVSAASLLLTSAPSSAGQRALPRASEFAPRVDNPWFPLRTGTVYVYRGSKDARPSRDVVSVLQATKTILGVRCTVVADRLFLSGRLEERTHDWYAQDRAGNVWYLGEATAELRPDGSVRTREGSWRAGVDGARAGIFMPAHPRPGDTGIQEIYRGHAEDHFRVLSLSATVSTPRVSSRRALLTREWTPLEPGVVDHKLYVRGVGTVLEQTVRGGDERNELVAIRPAPGR
jgi:hypothetical protein